MAAMLFNPYFIVLNYSDSPKLEGSRIVTTNPRAVFPTFDPT